jgi:hypothetical protein
MTDFHPPTEATSTLVNSLITKVLNPWPPALTASPNDANVIIEPGYCVCRVSFAQASQYPVKYRTPHTKRFLLCWLGYDELAGYGETHNDIEVLRIVESIDSVTSKRRIWAEPKRAPALDNHFWTYGGDVLEPAGSKWPFGFRIPLHNVAESLDRYTITKEETDGTD